MVWESPTKPWSLCSVERQKKLRQAWSVGNLRWKLDPSQQLIYDHIYASHATVKSSAERIFCMDVSRQSGKDFIMSIIAIEQMYRRRFPTRIPYGAPTKDTVHELLVPTMEAIFQDCPPELLPYEISKGTFRTNSHELNWHEWGGRIVLVGVDLHPDWLRGPATYAFMFTEPAFCDHLQELMESVLMPQMLTQQQGFGVMGSTPPVSPGHTWSTKYIPEAKKRNMYAKRTIVECPRFTPEQIQGFIKELGGMESTRVRRELFVEHIVESTLAVVPEFQDLKDTIVTEEGFDTPPAFRDTYVALDPGFNHATGLVMGYLDFATGLFMIEGDFAVQRMNSEEVARRMQAREWQLWGRAPQKPMRWTEQAWQEELALMHKAMYMDLPIRKAPVVSMRNGNVTAKTTLRVSDTDSRLIADLQSQHGITVQPTAKDDADAALNSLRVNLHKFRIHPRCVDLINHLSQATWNKSRTKITESAGGGHFDCVPAIVYLNRNINWQRNPNPLGGPSRITHHVPDSSWEGNKTHEALKRRFSRRKRR